MQRIDSDIVHFKKVRSYNDSNGFVNFFNISGSLKSIDRAKNRIELLINKKNPDYSIEIDIEGSNVPPRYRVGDEVTCTGFVRGANSDGVWRIRFRGKELSDVNVNEMGTDALLDWVRRMGKPYKFEDDLNERLSTPEFRRARAARRDGNYVGLSGFVDMMKFYPGKQINDQGKMSPDSLKMLIRQFEDERLNILVELNGKEARVTHETIRKMGLLGIPLIRFHGEAYVKIKDVSREVPVLDEQGNSVVDEEGDPVVQTQTETIINPCIKAIANITVANSNHYRQPKTVKDPETGKERTEYPYPWAKVYEERAQADRAKIRRRAASNPAVTAA